jgi:hypothetical protein
MILPDYQGGCLVNLMATVRAAFSDSPQPYACARDLDPAELSDAASVVLLVIDGMGADVHTVSPARIAYSDFNAAHCGRTEMHAYDGLAELFGVLCDIVRAPGGLSVREMQVPLSFTRC